MNVEIISSHDAFAGLADAWNAMPQARRSPLARHEWFASALGAFSSSDELAVFVAQDGGRIRAIAPLLIDRSLTSMRLNILGHQTQEPNAFLYSDVEALSAVCTKVLQSGWPAVFPRLPIQSEEVRLLQDGRRTGVLRARRTVMKTARIELSTTQALEAGMSSSSRASIRRKRKLAEREGAIRSEAIVPTANDLQPLLNEVFRIEGAGWKSQAGTSILSDHAMRRFYSSYAVKAARLGLLRIYFLRVGERAIATRLAVSFGGRLWELKIGYDEHWKHCSPGILLTHDTLRFACDEGLVGHEFLGGAEAWQQHWPIDTIENTSLRYYPISVNGGLSLGLDVYRVGEQRLRTAFGQIQFKDLEFSHPDV